MEEKYGNRVEYIVGIDIGSAAAKCMVGEISDGCNLKVIGAEEISIDSDIDSEENIKENAQRLNTLIKRVEEQSKLNIYTVYVTSGRGEIKGLNMTGSIRLNGTRISKKHCEKVLKFAERLSIPHGFELVHVLPEKYYINETKKVVDPVGFTADKLEVELHIITCDSRSLNLKRKLLRTAGYYIEGMVIDSLASFYGGRGLYSREKDVLVVNMGARNTDVLFFVDSQIVMTDQIFFGLDDIISEFEYRFGVTNKEAGRLLRSYMQYCNTGINYQDQKESSTFTIVQKKISEHNHFYFNDYKKISKNTISLVISYMLSQMIERIKSTIIAYLKGDINNIQVVLMGGGAYVLESEKEFKDKFRCEVVIGENKFKSGGDLFGTAYGLLRYGIHDRSMRNKEAKKNFLKKTIKVFQDFSTWAAVKLS